MEFNEVENLSEAQIMDLYSDVAETGNMSIAADGSYDTCYGTWEPHGMPPHCASGRIQWAESCMRCYDSNHDGIIKDSECYTYSVTHDNGPASPGQCSSIK